jgi:hypothetical protein
MIFLRHFGDYLLGKHINCELLTQLGDLREIVYSTSKAMKVLDISSKNEWISNIKLCL